MKKLLMLLPLLLVGCLHQVVFSDSYQVVSVATGTDGKVDYACSLLDTPNHPEINLFRCEFHNTTNQRQPGPAVHLALYSEKTGQLTGTSHPIYSLPLNPGQTNVVHTKYQADPYCGHNLEGCVVLVEKDVR